MLQEQAWRQESLGLSARYLAIIYLPLLINYYVMLAANNQKAS